MKKFMSIIVSILFALSLSGLAFAQVKPASKPAGDEVKAEEKAPAKDKKKADKKAKKSKKAKKAKKAPAKIDKNDPEGAGK
ncbi:MAG: hypothetical protein WC405_19440 [Syntrophales bacterium]